MALLPLNNGSAQGNGNNMTATERDILYKLFFDMKKDMNDLKKMMFEMAQTQGYPMAENLMPNFSAQPMYQENLQPLPQANLKPAASTPILIHNDKLDHHEEVEESLLLSEREKEFIVKALKKHKGRRRDAANELGISERTLYRKIKEYDIKE